MKILDVSSYNEKLKINPVSLDDFDKIDTSPKTIYKEYQKQDLKTGDICQINNFNAFKLGIVVMKETDIDLSLYNLDNYADDIPFILMYNEEKKYLKWTYAKLVDYDKSLHTTREYMCEIVKIMPNALNANILNNPDELAKQLINYKELFE